jgi:hypothetical protein
MNKDELTDVLEAQASLLVLQLSEHFDKRFAEQEARLTGRLDKRFDEQEARLTKRLDKRFDDGFLKLYHDLSQLFEARFAEQDAKLESFDVRLDRLQITLDGLVKRQESDDHERTALSSKVDRHEGEIKQLAAKVGLRLSHE